MNLLQSLDRLYDLMKRLLDEIENPIEEPLDPNVKELIRQIKDVLGLR